MFIGKRPGAVSIVVAGIVAFSGFSHAETTVKLTPTGFASYEVGQIVDYDTMTVPDAQYRPAHLMYQKSYVGFNVQSLYDPLPITTNLGVELKSFTETPRKKLVSGDAGVGVRFYYFLYLTRADFVYSPSEALNLQIGYFPVKYNDDARNLGEYFFRSGTYPQFLTSNFDFAAARVTGLNVFGTLFEDLKYKALFTVNTENATMGDLNFTAIASYSFLDKLFELGGGVSFCSFLSANQSHTHPPKEEAYNERARYINENGDTATFTFAGTKVMGRVSIDPKALFKSDLFGKEDLKIYAEAAVLGLKNYPVSVDTSSLGTRYDDILKRMPVMFGFNWPTHPLLVSIAPGLAELFIEREFDLSTILTGGGGLVTGGGLWLLERYTETKLRLDVLNIEMQWFGSPYPNDMTNVVYWGLPVPYTSKWDGGGYSLYADSTRDNWKWSIYAKKTFAGHFFAVFQVASDHYHWDRYGYADQANVATEALTQRSHKYWVMKLGYSF